MLDPVAPVCAWLKRDLRVTDHPALAEAAARDPVRQTLARGTKDRDTRRPPGAPDPQQLFPFLATDAAAKS